MFTTVRSLFLASLLSFQSVAWAGGIGVVDFQKAINEVKEGKAAKSKIDSMFANKRTTLQKQEQDLKTKFETYQKQKSLLSPAVQQEQEQALMQMQMQLQQAVMQSEQEVQQIYAQEMEALITKMKAISTDLGQTKSLDIILEATESGIVYQGPSIVDLTPDVIKMYDAKHGG
jgi:outer membrane protein